MHPNKKLLPLMVFSIGVALGASACAEQTDGAAESAAAAAAGDSLAAADSRDVFRDSWHGMKTLAQDTGHILVSPFRMGKRDALQLGAILTATGVLLIYDVYNHAAITDISAQSLHNAILMV